MPATEGKQFQRRMIDASLAVTLLNALMEIGGDAQRVLQLARLEAHYQPMLDGHVQAVPRRQFTILSRECVMALHHHACRRDRLRPLPVNQLHMMCKVMLASPDIGTAIETATEFLKLLEPRKPRFLLKVKGETASVTLNTGEKEETAGDMILAVYGLAAIHRLLCWLANREIPLTAAGLHFPGRHADPALDSLLQIGPTMEAPTDYLSFQRACLSWPIQHTYADLPPFFAHFPFGYLPPDSGRNSNLAGCTRDAICSALAHRRPIPDMKTLASMFGLTTATYRRRLSLEGATLSGIRNECRRKLALKLVGNTRLGAKEIAYDLQFQDTSSFHRAFRKWYGLPLSACRKQLGQPARA